MVSLSSELVAKCTQLTQHFTVCFTTSSHVLLPPALYRFLQSVHLLHRFLRGHLEVLLDIWCRDWFIIVSNPASHAGLNCSFLLLRWWSQLLYTRHCFHWKLFLIAPLIHLDSKQLSLLAHRRVFYIHSFVHPHMSAANSEDLPIFLTRDQDTASAYSCEVATDCQLICAHIATHHRHELCRGQPNTKEHSRYLRCPPMYHQVGRSTIVSLVRQHKMYNACVQQCKSPETLRRMRRSDK